MVDDPDAGPGEGRPTGGRVASTLLAFVSFALSRLNINKERLASRCTHARGHVGGSGLYTWSDIGGERVLN